MNLRNNLPNDNMPKAYDKYFIKDPYIDTDEDDEALSYFQSEQSFLEFQTIYSEFTSEENPEFTQQRVDNIKTYLNNLKQVSQKLITNIDEPVEIISQLFPAFIELNQSKTPIQILLILNQTLQEISYNSHYYSRQILNSPMLQPFLQLIQETANDNLKSTCINIFCGMFHHQDDDIQQFILSVLPIDIQFQILASPDQGEMTKISMMALILEFLMKTSIPDSDQYIYKIFECINQPDTDPFLIAQFLSTLGLYVREKHYDTLQNFPIFSELFTYITDNLLTIIDRSSKTMLIDIFYLIYLGLKDHMPIAHCPIDGLYDRLLKEDIENEIKELISNLIFNWIQLCENTDALISDKTIPVLVKAFEDGNVIIKSHIIPLLGKVVISNDMQLIHQTFTTSIIENFVQFIVESDSPLVSFLGYGIVGYLLSVFEVYGPYCEDHQKLLLLLQEYDYLYANYEKEFDPEAFPNIESIRDELFQTIQLHFSSFPGQNELPAKYIK